MSPTEEYEGRWWHRLEDGRLQCDLCPRRCRLKPGQRAFCFVRQSAGDRMLLTTYGRSSGFCIDPIEKKPLNHFLPGTPILSFGTAGCNLGCRFCQNWEISKSREVDSLAADASPEAITRAALQHGCSSVAFTYNDPVLWAEYAIDTAAVCHREGVATVAVTAGFITEEARGEFFEAIDAANVDLKAFTDSFYEKVCLSGLGGLQNVLDTLVWLRHESDTWIEITTLLIPGLNDSDREIRAECDWIARELGPDVPLHFTAFHPDFRLRDRPRTPTATCQRARRIGLEAGLHYVYTGNVPDPVGQTTYCPGCGAKVIGRDWHKLTHWAIGQGGHCTHCGTALAGHFEPRPGDWGRKRQRVRLADFAGQATL